MAIWTSKISLLQVYLATVTDFPIKALFCMVILDPYGEQPTSFFEICFNGNGFFLYINTNPKDY
jgi:hypothetical protein